MRRRQNLTQEKLASESGLHGTEISSLESGRRNPTYQALWRVSQGLGVTLSEVVALAEEIEEREAKTDR
jgi:transcriptional regulator with XRE-family HTH domain